MIAPQVVCAGQPITFEGYADDYGKRIVAIEFSLDDGEHWTSHDTSVSDPDLWTHWTFTYTPEQVGSYTLRIRSVNEEGKTSPQSAVAEFTVR